MSFGSSPNANAATIEQPHRLRTGVAGSRYRGKNFTDIFTILVLQLRLTESTTRKKFGFFAKHPHPFSFLVSEAVGVMNELSLDISQETVTTTVSYSIKPELALALLKKFFIAKFIHNPESRTDNLLTLESRVQVTPKGAAIVYHVCKKFGMDQSRFPELITSTLNTMNLFVYDRSDSNKLLYSEYVINILVTKMAGTSPNVWTPTKPPEMATNMFHKERSEVFAHPFLLSVEDFAPQKKMPPKEFISPFYHKYFSNPVSDAHIQYYESESGIRLYKNKVFEMAGKDITIEYCFPGRAIVQWLCDCTALFSVSEATEIGRLMVSYGLIIPVTDNNSGQEFINHRDAIYTLSEEGQKICQWNGGSLSTREGDLPLRGSQDDTLSETKYEQVSLKSILSDPGMRCLFKLHAERECYAENVEAYVKLVEFSKLKKKISRLWKLHKQCEDDGRRELVKKAIDRHTNACFSRALYLYVTYFSAESQFDVNLDFELRQEVHKVMLFKPKESPAANLSEYMKTPTYEKLLDWEVDGDNQSERDSCNGGSGSGSEPGSGSASGIGSESGSGSESGNGSASGSGHSSGGSECGSSSATEEPTDLTDRLNQIYTVFTRVTQSIYKLIEDDTYPRFIRSGEYTYAMGIKTHRS